MARVLGSGQRRGDGKQVFLPPTGPVNRLIGLLGKRAAQRLKPHLKEQELAFKQVLYEPGARVEHAYFPICGVVSVLTTLEGGQAIETATIGNEGFLGLALLLGVSRSAERAICQIPGRALCLPAAALASERKQATEWFQLLLRYAHFYTTAVAQTAACNRMHTIDARMSRWLLITHDRVAADDFPMTQEFLAQMLGVARPSVNIAGATLQKAGFIKYRRGRVTVLDRRGLESSACECYARIARALENLFNGRD